MLKRLMLAVALALPVSAAFAQAGAQAGGQGVKEQWGPVPPVLPAGAQIAVLQGNPFGQGVYTLRLKMPNGYTVPPHFHPTDEMLTVISGSLMYGHGDKIDRSAMSTLHAGGFTAASANMHHYVTARGATIVQVHGQGPFAITYVNPADNPQAKPK